MPTIPRRGPGVAGRRFVAVAVAVAVAVVLVLAGGWLAGDLGREGPGDADDREQRAARPVLGVYRGASNVAGADDFERWLGRDLGVYLDFLPGDSWGAIEGSSWLLRPWSSAGRTLVLTVPMLPGPWNRSYDGGVSLGSCSAGAYDDHWRRLAVSLVAHRLGHTILRVGHEFNAGWYPWRAAGEEQQFAGCFRRVVQSMRSVSGNAFTFIWNPALGRLDADPLLAYPGDAYVDGVGVDVYDQSWKPGTYPIPAGAAPQEVRERQERAWLDILHGDFGLEFWSRYARSRNKQLSIPEWGLTRRSDGHGGGDNPYFVEQMSRFVSDPANQVAYFIYFEHDARDGEHRLTGGRFTNASSSFRASFGDAG